MLNLSAVYTEILSTIKTMKEKLKHKFGDQSEHETQRGASKRGDRLVRSFSFLPS